MKKWNKKNGFLLMLICGSLSCNELWLPDLDGKTVQVLSPSNDLRFSEGELTFWWTSVQGAKVYEMQIVAPSFDTVRTIVTDTILNTLYCTVHIEPGKYQWRIRPGHPYSDGVWTYGRLEILASLDRETRIPSDHLASGFRLRK